MIKPTIEWAGFSYVGTQLITGRRFELNSDQDSYLLYILPHEHAMYVPLALTRHCLFRSRSASGVWSRVMSRHANSQVKPTARCPRCVTNAGHAKCIDSRLAQVCLSLKTPAWRTGSRS